MKRNLYSVALAILMAASTLAIAQVMRSTTSASPGMLLTRKDVQDDLKLSAKVRDQIKEMWSKLLADSGATSQGNGTYIIRNTGGMPVDPSGEMTKKALPLLNDPQKARLEQIRIQLGGPRIALDPAVKPKVKLTEAQATKISDLIAKEQTEVREMVQGAGGRVDQETMKKLKDIRVKTDAGVDKILTKAQKDKIKELGGAPFKAAS